MRVLRVALLALTSAIFPVISVSAQTRLFMLSYGCPVPSPPMLQCDGLVIDLDIERRTLTPTVVPHTVAVVSPPVTTPEGQYLIWSGNDSQGRIATWLSSLQVNARSYAPIAGLPGNSRVFAHPTELRAFVQTPLRDIQALELSGSQLMPMGCNASALGSVDLVAMSRDGSRLAIRCPTRTAVPFGPYVGDTFVVDSSSGGRVATIESAATAQALNDDGSELYVLDDIPHPPVYRRIQVATGAVLAARSVGDTGSHQLVIDQRRGRLFSASGGRVVVLDAENLAPLRELIAPEQGMFSYVVVDPDLPHVYVAWWVRNLQGHLRVALQQFEADGAMLLASAQFLLPDKQAIAGMVLGPRPPRPSDLSATVDGRQVALSWKRNGAQVLFTGAVVEAGSATGLTDLARLPVSSAESFVVEDVPPGTYYVRVRGANGTGESEPSNEVIVTVAPSAKE